MRRMTLRRIARAWALGALGALLPAGASAGDLGGPADRGTSAAQFLKVAPGARATGMGEAYSASCEDAYAAYYNPAGLARLRRVEVAASHQQRFQGIAHEFAAAAVPLLAWTESKRERSEFGVLAFALTSLSVGGIERRGLVETDEPTGSFGAADFAYALGYGYAFDRRLSGGITLKRIEQRIDAYRASASAVDAGGLYRAGRVSLSAGLRNFGGKVRFINAADPLPFTLYAGAAWRPSESWLLAADLRSPRDHRLGGSLGLEHRRRFAEDLSGALRAGYNSSNTDADGFGGVSLGGGVGYRQLEMDFSWVPRGELGDSYLYSLQIKF